MNRIQVPTASLMACLEIKDSPFHRRQQGAGGGLAGSTSIPHSDCRRGLHAFGPRAIC